MGDEPVGLVDDEEAALAAGLRGVQRGAHGGLGVVRAGLAQVEADGVPGQRPLGNHPGAHSASPARPRRRGASSKSRSGA
ncbi:hypothetical protein EAO70_06680 [Streptomyces sp. adm13(2018)]|nr:hypothetical protein EAO70_06680 [Streptomyces sp. adm13(2018)]